MVLEVVRHLDADRQTFEVGSPGVKVVHESSTRLDYHPPFTPAAAQVPRENTEQQGELPAAIASLLAKHQLNRAGCPLNRRNHRALPK